MIILCTRVFVFIRVYALCVCLQKDESAWTAEPRRIHCGGETAPDTTCVMRVASTIKWTGKTGRWLSPRDVWWVISPPLFAFGARYILYIICIRAPSSRVYHHVRAWCVVRVCVHNEIIVLPCVHTLNIYLPRSALEFRREWLKKK